MSKNFDFVLLTIIFLSVLSFSSCDRLGEGYVKGTGRLTISFVKGCDLFTKADIDIPDTADFLLKITTSSGNVIYDGKYGDCPESMEVASGNYVVKVVSSEFDKPAFDSPQFGDEQCVVVPEGGVGKVFLICRQINAGVRLDISSEFLVRCPGAVLFLKTDGGKLMYSYSERRTAYFKPGILSLIMSTGGKDEILMVRELAECEMLSLLVSVPVSGQSDGYSMSVSIDTARVWTNDECIIGNVDSGADIDDALSVAEARVSAGKEAVWVCGYVVGGDLTSSSASFRPPFESRTNILLGPKSVTEDRSVCLSVQLPAGEIRDRLNLVDNQVLLGKRICVKGDLVSAYYGLPGVKNTVQYTIL